MALVKITMVVLSLATMCQFGECRAAAPELKARNQQIISDLDMPDDIIGDVCELFCDTDDEVCGCSYSGPGPHDLTCLRSWWVDTGCSLDGTSSPDSDDAGENIPWWNERTADAVRADMALYDQYGNADREDYYTRCHGTIDPNACIESSGDAPHSMACLIDWWIHTGCSLDGTHSPIYKPDLYWWQQRSAHEVKADMAEFNEYADSDFEDYWDKCYGQLL